MPEEYSFIVVKYPEKETGMAALAVVQELAKQKIVKLKDAVAITKSDSDRIKLHQTIDDDAGTGFLKGGVIGLVFAVLFGGAGWMVAGALLGTAFAMFDRGIKNKLLTALRDEMTSGESALAVLIKDADWETLISRMQVHNFMGRIIVAEFVESHLADLEKLADNKTAIESVPDELELTEPVE